MKTNRSARRLLRIRLIALSLALVGAVGVVLMMGGSLAARYGQLTAVQNRGAQVPNLSVGDFVAAAAGVR